MFDFLFKRTSGKPSSEARSASTDMPEARANPAAAKEAALVQADALDGNESAAAEFILRCGHADARFKAAQLIRSKAVLEQVVQAMRNTDRRVVRLLQKRLEAILSKEKSEKQAQECIRRAQELIDEPSLMPNQVAELDRAWAQATDVAQPLRESFDHVRVTLRERLEAQAALQRAVIDVGSKLQKLTRAAIEAPHIFTVDRLRESFGSLEQEMAHYCADREAQVLPQHLMAEFARRCDHFKETLASIEKRNAAIAACEAALAEWESAPIAGLNEEALKRSWRTLSASAAGDAALESRFDALVVQVAGARKADTSAAGAGKRGRQHFGEALGSMEKALESGALQVAIDRDKALRAMNRQDLPPSDAARLAKARSELHRLQDWARWGGNVSREELLKAAQELPSKSCSVSELAKKVGSLRERWKALDASAGPAGNDLWKNFDDACTTAYAPAAEHFRKLADERHANLDKARSIIEEVKQFATSSGLAAGTVNQVDWKAVAAFSARAIQLWRHLGPIDRKGKKAADLEFETAMQLLSEPLTVQRKIEIANREKMIAQASELNAADRRAVDTLRALQERWQERARTLPLERKDEQALWQRFRGACDAVFAQRKDAAREADAERQNHLREREALCAMLEALETEPADVISEKMREAEQAWSRIGPVPRAAEQQIEKRYQSALAGLRKRISGAQRAVREAQVAALVGKLDLCHAMETMAAGVRGPDNDELVRSECAWQTLPALVPPWEQVLRTRFDRAVAALKAEDREYALLLERNRAVLAREVLRLEVVMGIDSPPEFSRERLELQVEVLQASLKAGQNPLSQQEQLLYVIRLPALTDRLLDNRIGRLVNRLEAFKL